MNSIDKITNQTIRKLILESEWGRMVRNGELEKYLIDEVHEFIDAVEEGKEDHMMEEAADVVMMLMYLVMKNKSYTDENVIENILDRINQKLRSRYSVFFEGISDGSEEDNWKQTKFVEKEILPYLFCPNQDCDQYGKRNKGQLEFKDGSVSCHTCRRKWKVDGNSLLLARCKCRRRLMEDLEKYFSEYLHNRTISANEYFASHLDDYQRVMRYAASYPVGYQVMQDYLTQGDYDAARLNEFLMLPLRDYIQYTFYGREESFRMRVSISDMLIQWMNKGYIRFRDMFCRGGNLKDRKLLLDCIRNIIASVNVTMTKSEMEDLNADEVVCQGRKREGKLLLQYAMPREVLRRGIVIRLYTDRITHITDIAGIVYALIIKTEILHKEDILLRIYDDNGLSKKSDFNALMSDMYPKIKSTEVVTED